MNNQRTFIIIALVITLFLLWNEWNASKNININLENNKQEVTQELANSSTSDLTNNNSLDIPKNINEDLSNDNEFTQQILDDDFTTVETKLLKVEISHTGGTIKRVLLKKYDKELNSKEKFELLYTNPGNIFQAKSGLYPDNEQFPNENSKYQSKQKNYTLTGDKDLIVPFTWTSDNGISVNKKYIFKPNDYVIEIVYDIENNTGSAQKVGAYTGLVKNIVDERGSFFIAQSFSGGALYIEKNDKKGVFEKIKLDEFNEQSNIQSKNGWAAFLQQYFLAAFIPNPNNNSVYKTKEENGLYKITIINPYEEIKNQQQKTIDGNKLYVGPKELEIIEAIAPGMDRTADYSFFYIFAKPLSIFLHWIYSFVKSWGLSIIIITIVIKLAFYKLTEKSYRSMAGMRKLTPRLQKIRETYKDDKQKIGRKTMELYKQEKVNPASGCIPILVQIPVFIAMYWVLREMVELRHTPFLYLPDLSAKDPYYIMPIIMGASMWFQQKLNPPPTDPMQAKIMLFLPLFFTVFFLFFPSGLVLYWVVNNILSIAQQMLINRSYDNKKNA